MIRFNSFNNFNYGSIFGYAMRANFGKIQRNTTAQRTVSTQRNVAANKNPYATYTANSGLSNISKESTELVTAARKLTDTGKNSLFAGPEDYDADAAYKAVNDFVSNYNETLNAVNQTTNTVVNNAAGSMTRMAGVMSGGLSRIGITVGKDGRMSVNEEEFKKAGYDKVKSMLGTSGSFTSLIASSAQRLGSAAEQQSRQTMSNAGLYSRFGSYFGNAYSGSLFNGWF